MYSRFKLASRYIKYFLTASNSKGHGTHSPFVFHFISKILNDKQRYPEYDKVEGIRSALLKNSAVLSIEDFGAGSGTTSSNKRTISSIAKNAAKPAKYGQLLHRMIKAYQPNTILELGTSLGITTSYLASAKPEATVITMEGSGEVLGAAKNNFKQAGFNNIETVLGNFDDTLPRLLNRITTIDFAFIDGNHRQVPTENYFKWLLPKLSNDAILVFDDIHWSKEMEAAWTTVINHPAVTCSIDLFFVGVVTVRKEFLEKQHFAIRY